MGAYLQESGEACRQAKKANDTLCHCRDTGLHQIYKNMVQPCVSPCAGAKIIYLLFS